MIDITIKMCIEMKKEITEKLRQPVVHKIRLKYEGCLGLIQRLEIELLEILKTV
jgi:hypothetical protein